MKAGDIFTLDAQAIEETAEATNVALLKVQEKLSPGDVFSISKTERCAGILIGASRWVNGKPIKGRPRRFSAPTVARLLGETYTAPQAAEEDLSVTVDAELEAHAADLLAASEEVEVASQDTSSLSW